MFQTLLIFLSFACIHSITVSRWFKDLCTRMFGEGFMRGWYRILYNIVSLITMLIAFRMIRSLPDRHLWTAPDVLRWTMYAARSAAIVFGALAFQYLDGLEFLGLRQVWRYLTGGDVKGNVEGLTGKDLVTKGVYGIVRHPLYVAGIVVFTVNPHVTVNGLTVTVLADLYFFFGMMIEERRFLGIFGDQYREYMLQVPRMMPNLFGRRGNGRRGRNP